MAAVKPIVMQKSIFDFRQNLELLSFFRSFAQSRFRRKAQNFSTKYSSLSQEMSPKLLMEANRLVFYETNVLENQDLTSHNVFGTLGWSQIGSEKRTHALRIHFYACRWNFRKTKQTLLFLLLKLRCFNSLTKIYVLKKFKNRSILRFSAENLSEKNQSAIKTK